MGNKATSTQQDKKDNQDLSTTITPPAISRDSFHLFLQCLHKLPFTLTEEQFENIIYDLQEKIFEKNHTVLRAGQNASGIFVLIDGQCNVIGSDGVTIINQLRKDDMFGEISSLYDVPCTCTIQVSDIAQCKIVFLEYSKLKNMIRSDSTLITMKEWFIKQNYLDCARLFLVNEISQQIIKRKMYQCPMFYGWSENALSFMYDKLQGENIEVYQANVCLAFENDEEMHIIVLIKGEVDFIRNGTSITHISSMDNCICFQDESIFIEDTKQLFTIKAKTVCQVVIFTQENFEYVTDNFVLESSKLLDWSHKWHIFYDNFASMLHNFSELVYYPLLMKTLHNTKVFCKASSIFLYSLVLGMTFESIDASKRILDSKNIGDKHNIGSILLLAGSAEISSNSRLVKILSAGDLYKIPVDQKLEVYITATKKCIAGYISRQLFDTLGKEFPEIVLDFE